MRLFRRAKPLPTPSIERGLLNLTILLVVDEMVEAIASREHGLKCPRYGRKLLSLASFFGR